MQTTFTTLDVENNYYNIDDRKNFGDKVVKIENVKIIVSLLI